MIDPDEEVGCGSTAGNGGSGNKSRYLAGSRRLRAGWVCPGLGLTGVFNSGCVDGPAGGFGGSSKGHAEREASWG